MTDADKTRIEIEKEAEEFGNGFVMVASQNIARIGYITGATVWAERLKEERNKAIDAAQEEFKELEYTKWTTLEVLQVLESLKSNPE